MSNKINSKEILVISNLAYGSDKERLDRIREIYEIAEEKRINTIINCGNLVAGYKNEEDEENRNITLANERIKHVINFHPKKDKVKLYTIAGSSDKIFMNKERVNVCEEIAKKRDDIVYLGDENVNIDVAGLKIKLYSRAISSDAFRHNEYVIKKMAEEEPNLDLICVGPNYSTSFYQYDKTGVLFLGSVSDIGEKYHGAWIIRVNDNKKDLSKKTYSLETQELRTCYDKELEISNKNNQYVKKIGKKK